MTTTRYNNRSVRNAMARMGDGMSSFDEQPVAVSSILFDLKSVYPFSRLRDRKVNVVGAGSDVIQAGGRFEVFTDAGANSEITFRSAERARYVAGYDGIPGIACNLDSLPTGNAEVEWGNTDFQNGSVTGVDAVGMYTRLYSGGIPSDKKYQESWEYGRNKTLNPLNIYTYRSPYRWYSTGPYRLMVDHIGDDGIPTVLPLDLIQSQDATLPITEDPNQPISLRIKNNGTAAPLKAYVMGRQYAVMGDYKPNRRFVGDRRLAQSVNNTFVPLIAFRQKNAVYESISTKLGGIGIITTQPLVWEIRMFGEPADEVGGTWRAPRLTDLGVESAMEVNTNFTTIPEDSGIQLWIGDPIPANQANGGAGALELPNLDIPAEGVGDILVLCARTIRTVSATVTSTFRIREEW